MAKRYTLTEKATGKVVLNLPYETREEIELVDRQSQRMIVDSKVQLIEVVKDVPVDPGTSTPETPKTKAKEAGGNGAGPASSVEGQQNTRNEAKTAGPKQTRKECADKGKPRVKKGETTKPTKKIRVRKNGPFVVTSMATICVDRDELDSYLASLSESGNETARVFNYNHELSFEIKRKTEVILKAK